MKHFENSKPSVKFDQKYGTNISYKYDFSPYTDDYLWDVFLNCLDLNDEDLCEDMDEFIPMILSKLPDQYFSSLYQQDIMTVIFGILSGYHPKDIIQFISGITYSNNFEAKEFEKNMKRSVDPNFSFDGWVPSYYTLNKLNKHFGFRP